MPIKKSNFYLCCLNPLHFVHLFVFGTLDLDNEIMSNYIAGDVPGDVLGSLH